MLVSASVRAASLGSAALTRAWSLQVLQLKGSQDLVCMNMMCEKLGDPCLCRVSVALQRLHKLAHLDLSENSLPALPDAVHPQHLPELRALNLSNNRITSLPASILQFGHLEVCRPGLPFVLFPSRLKH